MREITTNKTTAAIAAATITTAAATAAISATADQVNALLFTERVNNHKWEKNTSTHYQRKKIKKKNQQIK